MTNDASETSAARFWNWFEKNQQRYRNLDTADDTEQLIDELVENLQHYDSKLFALVSEPMKDQSLELVVTADGEQDRFSTVENLIANAPSIPGWKFLALKPAQGFEFVHSHNGLKLDPSHLWFLPMHSKSNPRGIGLRMGIPEWDETEEERMFFSLWIILDTGLGERLTAERIQHLEAVRLPDQPENAGYIELPELPVYIEWWDKQSREE